MSQVEIKPSLLSYKLAELIAIEELESEKSITLKENYIRLIDQLQIDGVPNENISALGKQIIIEKKKQKLQWKGIEAETIAVGSWWYQVAREQGCTDSRFSPVKQEVTDVERERLGPLYPMYYECDFYNSSSTWYKPEYFQYGDYGEEMWFDSDT